MININTLLSRKLSDLSINRFKTGYIILLYAALLAVLCVLVWVSFRGFDKTDESFYLVGYLQGIEPAFSYSQYHKIYNTFFGFLNLTIVEIRLLRLLLVVISSLLFTHAMLTFLNSKKIVSVQRLDFHFLLYAIITGSLIGYIWLPQTISYNFFSYLFFQLIIAFYFYAENARSFIKRYLYQFGVGFFLGASFFNKFPNFVVCFAALLLFSVIIRENQTIRKKVATFFIDILFYFLGIFTFMIFLYQDQIITEVGKLFGMIMASGDKNTFDHKEIYLKDFNKLFTRTYPYLLIVGSFNVFYYWLVNNANNKVLVKLSEWALVLFLLLFIIIHDSFIGGISRKYLHFDFYLIISVAYLGILIVHKNLLNTAFYKTLTIYLFLLSFLLGSLGTNNGLSAQFLIYSSFLMAAIVTVTLSIRKVFLYLILLIATLTAASQIITGVLLDPYREVHNYEEQTFEINDVPGFKYLKVDSASYDLKTKLEGVRSLSAKHLYVYSHQSGYALLADKTPYGFGWYSQWNPSICVNLVQHAKYVEENDLIFILPEEVGLFQEISDALKKKGVFFPEHYKMYNQFIIENCKNGEKETMNVYVFDKDFGLSKP